MVTGFEWQIEQINMGHAIKMVARTGLTDILLALTKEKLSYLASVYELPGRSKMNKPELATSLFGCITDIDNIEDILLIADPKELQLLATLLDTTCLKDGGIVPGDYLYLMKRGLLFSFYYNDELIFVAPDEIKDVYKRINKNAFNKKRERYQLIYSYILALANLYGIYKPQLLLEIFNAQNSEKLDDMELMQIYWCFCQRQQIFFMHGAYIASDYFQDTDTDDEFKELDSKYEKVSHYIPEKEELLKYKDDMYYEATAQLTALRKHILHNICNDEELVDELVDDIQLQCSLSWSFSMQDIFFEFERRNIQFKNKKTIDELLPYITDVINNTRLWVNGGHTPAEMKKAYGLADAITKSSQFFVRANNQIGVAKIGRNEPCPCGSGKKYKKCCGK